MLNKGSVDKWNSQRAGMPTSLSSSSPYNCLSMSQQVSPEVAAAPLSGPAFYKRLGRKEVGFILRVSSESQLVEMFWGGFQTAKSRNLLSKCLKMTSVNSLIAGHCGLQLALLDTCVKPQQRMWIRKCHNPNFERTYSYFQ